MKQPYTSNSDISNNIYYLDLDSVQDRKPETRKAKVLGKIIDKDRIAALIAKKISEKKRIRRSLFFKKK